MSAFRLKNSPPETLGFAAAAAVAVLMLGIAPAALPLGAQIALLAVTVVVLGLPHGALDAWIARRAGLYKRPWGWAGFNLAYLVLALAVVGAWWLFPITALVGFLMISAWHFAGDWQATLEPWQKLIAAAALLGMPALFHAPEVAAIFIVLSGPGAEAVAQGLGIVGLLALAALGPVLLIAAKKRHWTVIVELGGLLVLAFFAPPLVYFALYFCLLHSPRHLRATIALAPASERRSLIGQAVVYTLATLALAALVAALVLPSGNLSEIALQMVFIGLAALTVPHMLLMLWAEGQQGNVPAQTPVEGIQATRLTESRRANASTSRAPARPPSTTSGS
ncbi:MAG: Brp/Blh family beta-carotene 15,15'-dioxygenase [Wenzhouxiangella sp.]